MKPVRRGRIRKHGRLISRSNDYCKLTMIVSAMTRGVWRCVVGPGPLGKRTVGRGPLQGVLTGRCCASGFRSGPCRLGRYGVCKPTACSCQKLHESQRKPRLLDRGFKYCSLVNSKGLALRHPEHIRERTSHNAYPKNAGACPKERLLGAQPQVFRAALFAVPESQISSPSGTPASTGLDLGRTRLAARLMKRCLVQLMAQSRAAFPWTRS
jgi:hypothetical protein